MRQGKQVQEAGFSMLELLIVIAIMLIVAAIGVPKMMTVIDQQKLQTSAQTYASFIQLARERAIQDDQFYQIENTTIGGNKPIVYLDMNGNGTLDASEPSVQLPSPVIISDTGVPLGGFGNTTLLNAKPLTSSTTNPPPMTALDGTQRAGLAFNGRGLPCQRYAATDPCTVSPSNPGAGGGNVVVAWVTFLQYQMAGGGLEYAAISVTPAGRVKTWLYDPISGQWR